MSRALRRTAGWTFVLGATVLLSLMLTSPLVAPEAPALAGALSPTPAPTPASGYRDDELPPLPHWPGPNRGAGSAGQGRTVPLSEEEASALQAATDRAKTKLGVDALAIGVLAGDAQAWTGLSGLARDGSTPLDGHSPFGIASVTKTFTAAIVLQLIEEGRFALDDEIATLMPDAGLPAGVTVRELLSHTSGIADLLAPMRELMNADTQRLWTGPEVLSHLGSAWFEPGRSYAYSNSNYVILGMLIEHVTGRSFADELADRITGPLELADTGVLGAPGAPPLMTPSWASAFGTSGYMYSSANDLLAWADALYGGRVLSRESLASMLTFSKDDYGLGAQRIQIGDRVGYGHSGLLRGYTSLLVRFPADDLTLVVIGSWQGFEPGQAFTWAPEGERSVLEIALEAASRPG